MFAVIKTGGKQYRVAAEDVIRIEKVAGEPGDIVELGEVLMLGGDNVTFGTPTVSGATVAGEVVEQGRGAKVIAFKKRRRKNSRRKRGHRQEFTLIRITEILTDGKKPAAREKPKPEPKPKVETPPDAEEASETAAAPKKGGSKAKKGPKPVKKAAPKAKKKPAKAAKKPAKPARAKPAKKGKKK